MFSLFHNLYLLSVQNKQSMTDKTSLRLLLKSRRAALTKEERREKSASITQLILDSLADKTTILAYAAKDPEVETLPLISSLIAAGKTVAVPIIEKETRTLRLSRLESIDHLEPSTFNVPEPISHEIPISPKEIQTVLLPIVGFDKQGNRLGYGAGYYDRFLAANPHLEKIGLAFSCQEVEEVPTDEYDIRMDMIFTEKGRGW